MNCLHSVICFNVIITKHITTSFWIPFIPAENGVYIMIILFLFLFQLLNIDFYVKNNFRTLRSLVLYSKFYYKELKHIVKF